MILCLKTASDDDIALTLARPALVLRFLSVESTEEERREMLEGQPSERKGAWGFLSKLFGKRESRESKAATPPPLREGFGEREEEADLDKAWHAIHWLLTGSNWDGELPLATLLSGGREVGKGEVGYGAARAVTAAETRAFYEAIAPLTIDQLRSRYDGKKMDAAEVYPEIWERDGVEEGFDEYIAHYFEDLKAFVAKAVEAKKGLIVWLS